MCAARCGKRSATVVASWPVAPPTSHSVRYFVKSTLSASALKFGAGEAAHRGHELLEARRIGVQLVEHRAAVVLDLVLRLAGFQRRAEIVPVAEEPRVQHLQHAAHVAGLVLVEERRGVRRVAVLARGAVADAVEEPERHERVEEIVDAARVQTQHTAQLGAGEERAPRVVNTPNSTAVSSTFEGQNAAAVSMIFAGFSSATVKGDRLGEGGCGGSR